MIIRIKKNGLVYVAKTSSNSYSLSCGNLVGAEAKAFESGLLAFVRSFENVTLSRRRQSHLALKGKC